MDLTKEKEEERENDLLDIGEGVKIDMEWAENYEDDYLEELEKSGVRRIWK